MTQLINRDNAKVALVLPPTDIREHYGALSRAAPEMPPLGLAFIAKYLSRQKVDVDIYDFSVDRKKLSVFWNNIYRYKIIGMPVYITSLSSVMYFIDSVKRRNPFCYTVLGGPHATLFPKDLFSNSVDIIVQGEGEVPFYQLYSKIINADYNFSSIKGLCFKNNGEYKETGGWELIENLDSIDSPFLEKFNLSLYYPPVHILGRKIIHTITSRGCPYNCRFCAATQIFRRKIRYRNIDLVIRELVEYEKMGYDSVMFYDDSFTIDKERVIDLCKKIIKQKLKIKWMCFTRPDLVERGLLKYMKEAGCYLVTFGCETGNNKTLHLLNKNLTVEKNYEGIKLTNEAGIITASTFMIGLPGEDYSDIEKTIEFAKNSGLSFAYFPIFEPYKGTAIYDICKITGTWVKNRVYRNYMLTGQEEVWVPAGLSRKGVEWYASKAFKEFYLRKKTIVKLLGDVILNLSFKRKVRLILSGVDYFILNKFRNSQVRIGTRY